MQSKIPVAEIFGPTIQGEGPNVGIKTLFVRVVGCDFNCSWCDSKFAWKNSENTKQYTSEQLIETLIEKCKQTYTSNVVLTGGNPCLYDFENVITQLHCNGISVDVETQGSKFPGWLTDVDTLVFSPKAPSSNQKDVYDDLKKWLDNTYNNFEQRQTIAIKIPVFNDEDFDFALKYCKMVNGLVGYSDLNIKMYLSVGNTNTTEQGVGTVSRRILIDYEKLINKVMSSKMNHVYILPQVHTLVWGNKQGV